MSSSILEEAVAGEAVIQPLTVEVYHQSIRNGSLPEDTRFELLDGFIVGKNRAKAGGDLMTIGDRHRIAVTRLAHLVDQFDSHGCFLQSQQPVTLPPHSEPEPDASIIKGVLEDYREHPPRGIDAICVIEVADASLSRDLGPKLRMYAQAGIPHYIVVDLVHNVVLFHTNPSNSTYPKPVSLLAGEILAIPTASSGHTVNIPIATLLP